jgi:NitT/TauT family transport system substrate-binding protein
MSGRRRPHAWVSSGLALALLAGACGPSAPAAPGGRAAPNATAGPAASADIGSPAAAPASQPAATSQGVGATPVSFVLGISSISPTHANLQAAKDAGIFLKYWLDPELQYIGGGTNSIAAMLSGNVGILAGGVPVFVSAELENAGIALIAIQGSKFDYYFVTTPDIKQPEDLRGKNLSGTRKGALADTAIRLVLRRWGLEPDRDVNIVPAGAGNDARTTALLNGAAVGTVLNVPLPGPIAQGNFAVLADLTKMDVQYANTGVAVRRASLAREPDFYERFLRAYIEGNHYFKTHPEEGARAIMTWVKTDDADYAKAAYEFYAAQLPRSPTTTPAAMQAVLDSLADDQPIASSANPERFLDFALLEKIEASGLVRQLYGD